MKTCSPAFVGYTTAAVVDGAGATTVGAVVVVGMTATGVVLLGFCKNSASRAAEGVLATTMLLDDLLVEVGVVLVELVVVSWKKIARLLDDVDEVIGDTGDPFA